MKSEIDCTCEEGVCLKVACELKKEFEKKHV
jgi:hypothetical protein